jgi:hypothetical protein
MSSLTCHPTSAAASSMSRWLSKEKGTKFRLDSPQRPVLRDSRRRPISCEVEDAESSAAKTWLTCVKDFDISKARLIGFTRDACACGSFRKQDKILWTTPCHSAQGTRTPTHHGARRCGNRIAYVPPWPIDPVRGGRCRSKGLAAPRFPPCRPK